MDQTSQRKGDEDAQRKMEEAQNMLREIMEATRPGAAVYFRLLRAGVVKPQSMGDCVAEIMGVRFTARTYRRIADLYNWASQLYAESPGGEWSRTTIIERLGGRG